MSSVSATSVDIAVIGGGPAGIVAAVTAAESSRDVVLIDDNPKPGGQIWRQGTEAPHSRHAAFWFERLVKSRAQTMHGARVIHAERNELQIETDDSVSTLRFEKLILATGARELFLPFPGWTLPNVVGAGGLQALVKSGLDVTKKRVVVAGTGPLLLAIAAYSVCPRRRSRLHLRTSINVRARNFLRYDAPLSDKNLRGFETSPCQSKGKLSHQRVARCRDRQRAAGNSSNLRQRSRTRDSLRLSRLWLSSACRIPN